MVGAPGGVEQRGEDGRCARQDRDPLGLDERHRRVEVERRDRVQGCAGEQPGDDADLVAEGVEERVDHQVAVLAVDAAQLAPGAGHADGLSVGRHRALAAAGGAGREEDVGDVTGGDGLGDQVDLGRRHRPAVEVGQVAQLDDGQDRGEIAGRAEVGDLGAAEEPVLHHDDAGAGAVDDVGDLVAGVAGVHRHQGAAGVRRGEGGDHPADAVGCPDAHAVAGLQAERDVASRGTPHPAQQLEERDHLVTLDVGRVVAEAVRRVAERGWDRADSPDLLSQPSNCLVEYHPWT